MAAATNLPDLRGDSERRAWVRSAGRGGGSATRLLRRTATSLPRRWRPQELDRPQTPLPALRGDHRLRPSGDVPVRRGRRGDQQLGRAVGTIHVVDDRLLARPRQHRDRRIARLANSSGTARKDCRREDHTGQRPPPDRGHHAHVPDEQRTAHELPAVPPRRPADHLVPGRVPDQGNQPPRERDGPILEPPRRHRRGVDPASHRQPAQRGRSTHKTHPLPPRLPLLPPKHRRPPPRNLDPTATSQKGMLLCTLQMSFQFDRPILQPTAAAVCEASLSIRLE
jgi:hypothetical protein